MHGKPFEQHMDEVYYEPNTGCWLWPGYVDRNGYGLGNFRGKRHFAHRASYMLLVGEIDESLYVLHKCDVPACVNPGHLFLGTQADNMADMARKHRHVGSRGKKIRSGPRKISDEVVMKIRTDGRSGAAIARDYGISRSHANLIKASKTRPAIIIGDASALIAHRFGK